MTLLYNLFSIGKNLPAIIAIIKSLIDIIGSAQVQSVLESIKAALKKEVPTPDFVPKTEPERETVRKRLQKRMALAELRMTTDEHIAFCRVKGIERVDS